MDTIPADVAQQLGYYVYLYVNPINGEIFYVGKGKGSRATIHLKRDDSSRMAETIRAIRLAGGEPRIDILAHGLPTEETAFRLEAAVIDLLERSQLTNKVSGWRSTQFGRVPLQQLVAAYRKKPVEIQEPAILIRVNQLYRPTMSPAELYDVTRSAWVVGPQREQAKYAVAVFEGIVREVYEITAWMPEGMTFRTDRPLRERLTERWEFVGRLAPEHLRRRYTDGYVGDEFPQGAQNPIRYVNITADTPKSTPTIGQEREEALETA